MRKCSEVTVPPLSGRITNHSEQVASQAAHQLRHTAHTNQPRFPKPIARNKSGSPNRKLRLHPIPPLFPCS